MKHRIILLLCVFVLTGLVSAQDGMPPISVELMDIVRYGDQYLSSDEWHLDASTSTAVRRQVSWQSSNLGAVIQISYLRFGYALDETSINNYFDDDYIRITFEPYEPYVLENMCRFGNKRVHEITGTTRWGEEYILREWVEQITSNELRVIFAAFPQTQENDLILYGTRLFHGLVSCDATSGFLTQQVLEGVSQLTRPLITGPERLLYRTIEDIESEPWFDDDDWQLFNIFEDATISYGAYIDQNSNILIFGEYQTWNDSWLFDESYFSTIFSDLSLKHIAFCRVDEQSLYVIKARTYYGQLRNLAILFIDGDIPREIRFSFDSKQADELEKLLFAAFPDYDICELEDMD